MVYINVGSFVLMRSIWPEADRLGIVHLVWPEADRSGTVHQIDLRLRGLNWEGG